MGHTAGGCPPANQPIPFPSVDPGLPAKAIDDLLRANEDLLARIKLCYGADLETFEGEVLPLIRRYARYVHLLPATPDNYFSDAGGLLRLGLEVGFYALQGTDGHIFSGRATITARKHLEPRWRLATLIAGLCCEIHLAVGRVLVTDVGGAQWTPYLAPLSDWLREQHADRYFLKWLPAERPTRALGLFALQHVVSREMLQHLSVGNAVIVPHMLGSVAGLPMVRWPGGEHNVVDDLVRRAFALVVDRDLCTRADRLGSVQLGAHVERYVLDAIRRLVAGGASWTPNTERSRLWFGADGLFMIWPQAAGDIRKLLEADQIPGIPTAPQTLADLLVASGIAAPRTAQEMVWSIAPPPGRALMEALKISHPALVFAGLAREPAALPQYLQAAAAGPIGAAGQLDGVQAPEMACADGAIQVTADDSPGGAALALPSQGDAQSPSEGGVGNESDDGRQLSLLDSYAKPKVPLVDGLECAGADVSAVANVNAPAASPRDSGSRTLSTPSPATHSDQSMRPAPTAPRAAASHGARLPKGSPLPPPFELDAPMRLDPAVRAALAAAIAATNKAGQGPATMIGACTVPSGVFVPLREFEQRGVEPSLAVRLLSELGMLADPVARSAGSAGHTGARRSAAQPSGHRTVVRDFGGTEVIGVIVLPRFVKGLDPRDFMAHPTASDTATGRRQPC